MVKEQLRHEKYLDCTEGDKRKALIELRSGANDLEVDKGRREKKELKDRICEECRGAVEDEIHCCWSAEACGHEGRNVSNVAAVWS